MEATCTVHTPMHVPVTIPMLGNGMLLATFLQGRQAYCVYVEGWYMVWILLGHHITTLECLVFGSSVRF